MILFPTFSRDSMSFFLRFFSLHLFTFFHSNWLELEERKRFFIQMILRHLIVIRIQLLAGKW